MSNRTDWENVAREIEGLGRDRLIAELHNAFVAGQEASADPDLVRQLIALQWGGAHLMAMCPQCQGLQRNGHYPDCELAAALAKAGVSPQSKGGEP